MQDAVFDANFGVQYESAMHVNSAHVYPCSSCFLNSSHMEDKWFISFYPVKFVMVDNHVRSILHCAHNVY